MRRLRFSLPFFSIISTGIGFLMLWGFLTIFNAIRFTVCPSWVLLQPPPGNTVALLGTVINRLYVQTENKSVYCLKKDQWSTCVLPSYGLQPDMAPSWLINNSGSAFESGAVLQLIRSNGFYQVTYYSLHADGKVFSCSTNIELELENIFSSGKFVWLLIPLTGMACSIATFVNLFIKYGQPALWDFWGRGEKIK